MNSSPVSLTWVGLNWIIFVDRVPGETGPGVSEPGLCGGNPRNSSSPPDLESGRLVGPSREPGGELGMVVALQSPALPNPVQGQQVGPRGRQGIGRSRLRRSGVVISHAEAPAGRRRHASLSPTGPLLSGALWGGRLCCWMRPGGLILVLRLSKGKQLWSRWSGQLGHLRTVACLCYCLCNPCPPEDPATRTL